MDDRLIRKVECSLMDRLHHRSCARACACVSEANRLIAALGPDS